jgi:hypothetical protein
VAAAHIHGGDISLAWSLPFIGMLLSVALLPLLTPSLWEHPFAKIAGFWTLAFILLAAFVFDGTTAAAEAWRALLGEYLPFILLLLTLFVVACSIRVVGNLVDTAIIDLTPSGFHGAQFEPWTLLPTHLRLAEARLG